MLIPLKKKHRTKKAGTFGAYRARTGNSNGRLKSSSIWAQIQESAKKLKKRG